MSLEPPIQVFFYTKLVRVARVRYVLAVEKKVVIKVKSRFYLYYKTKI